MQTLSVSSFKWKPESPPPPFPPCRPSQSCSDLWRAILPSGRPAAVTGSGLVAGDPQRHAEPVDGQLRGAVVAAVAHRQQEAPEGTKLPGAGSDGGCTHWGAVFRLLGETGTPVVIFVTASPREGGGGKEGMA